MPSTSRKIVICGAGIAGISAAYHLAVEHGQRDVVIVEEGNPLSLTSDKSTEAYRNWWPGPDRAMTAFMNRSIDLMQQIADATGNRINLNRRGYLFATGDAGKIAWLRDLAQSAEAQGSGPARFHETASSAYSPSPEDSPRSGADVVTDRSSIRRHFPYLAPETVAVLHARRAGWLSAQQLGMTMLEAARGSGVRLVRGKVVGVDSGGGRVRAVHVQQQGERQTLEATHLVLAAGPMLKDAARLVGVELPIIAERHLKISLPDTLGIVPRQAPMLIWLDEQHLPWSDEERATLAEDEFDALAVAPISGGRARAPRWQRNQHHPARPLQLRQQRPPTWSFPCRASRTTPRSRCAACRPWFRPCAPTSRRVRGRTSTAATTSRRARTGH